MSDPIVSPLHQVRSLIQMRQTRKFTDKPVGAADLEAMTEVARWSGSSFNEQPWRFIVIRDVGTLRCIAEVGLPQTRALHTAMAGIAVALPDEADEQVSRAYDEGRATERILIAASMLGLGSGITWIRADVRAAVDAVLALPPDWLVRTIVAVGHPTEAAGRPRSTSGQARRPRRDLIFDDRWPAG